MKLLHIEDCKYDAELIGSLVRTEWPDCTIVQVASRAQLVEQIERGGFDLVLSDYTMPGFDGLSALTVVRSMCPDKPFIFLSGTIGEERAIEALKRGAMDYVIKDRPARLVPAIRQALEVTKEQQRLKQAEEQVRQQTHQLAEVKERLAVLDKTKGEFLKLISHELRTPLNGLFGITDIIFDDLPANSEVDEYRRLFEESRERLLRIIEDALLLCQIEADGPRFAPEPISFNKVVAETIEATGSVARSANVSLGDAPDCPGFVIGARILFKKALYNLVETAVKLSASGGIVSFAASATSSEISLIMETAGRTVPADIIPVFFDVFAVSNPIIPGGDLGLGPPIAHRIISLFGGSVAIENRDPKGVRIRVRMKSGSAPGTASQSLV